MLLKTLFSLGNIYRNLKSQVLETVQLEQLWKKDSLNYNYINSLKKLTNRNYL